MRLLVNFDPRRPSDLGTALAGDEQEPKRGTHDWRHTGGVETMPKRPYLINCEEAVALCLGQPTDVSGWCGVNDALVHSKTEQAGQHAGRAVPRNRGTPILDAVEQFEKKQRRQEVSCMMKRVLCLLAVAAFIAAVPLSNAAGARPITCQVMLNSGKIIDVPMRGALKMVEHNGATLVGSCLR